MRFLLQGAAELLHNRCIWHNVVTIILRSDYFRDETFRVKTGIFLFAFISIDWIVVSWYSFTNKKKLQVRVIGMQMNKITHSITFLQFNRRYGYTYELIFFFFFQTIESDRQDWNSRFVFLKKMIWQPTIR